jgi:hypothetical protein
MPLRKPEDFAKEDSRVFRKAPVDADAIRGWVAMAQDKARDSMNAENSNSTRLGAAYDAVLNLSLAVLSSRGWRATAADGHHKQSLEAAYALAALSTSAFDDMDAVRDIRNQTVWGRGAIARGRRTRDPVHEPGRARATDAAGALPVAQGLSPRNGHLPLGRQLQREHQPRVVRLKTVTLLH